MLRSVSSLEHVLVNDVGNDKVRSDLPGRPRSILAALDLFNTLGALPEISKYVSMISDDVKAEAFE